MDWTNWMWWATAIAVAIVGNLLFLIGTKICGRIFPKIYETLITAKKENEQEIEDTIIGLMNSEIRREQMHHQYSRLRFESLYGLITCIFFISLLTAMEAKDSAYIEYAIMVGLVIIFMYMLKQSVSDKKAIYINYLLIEPTAD